MSSGLASCTGLSILMIDACRACGIPARFVGIPMWPDKSGNHSWVEIWDNGWHFTGACEATGDELNRAWFTDRAATAIRDNPLHSIYAVSFQRTPLSFPFGWNRGNSQISAVNVTDRYTQLKVARPEGTTKTMFRVVDPGRKSESRQSCVLPIRLAKLLQKGIPMMNDLIRTITCHFIFSKANRFTVTATNGERTITKEFKVESRDRPIELVIE